MSSDPSNLPPLRFCESDKDKMPKRLKMSEPMNTCEICEICETKQHIASGICEKCLRSSGILLKDDKFSVDMNLLDILSRPKKYTILTTGPGPKITGPKS